MKAFFVYRMLPIFAVTLAGVIATGCNTQKQVAKLDFQPAISRPIIGAPKATLRVSEFEDYRPIYDKTVISPQRNGHGLTTSSVVATQDPVASIFRSGLVKALEDNNFKLAPGQGLYELRGGIQNLEYNVATDFWNATGRPKLEVRFELINTLTGNSVWQKSYVGGQTVSTPWSSSKTMAKLFNESANDVVHQLLTDPSFRRYFEVQN